MPKPTAAAGSFLADNAGAIDVLGGGVLLHLFAIATGSVGDANDNAMAESFFATLECELLDRRKFKTQAEARMAVV